MTATDKARGDHRCKPGRKTVDRRCTWHPTHHWCEACAGWYGVPHDVYSCHTTQQGIRKLPSGATRPMPGQCACRYCTDRAVSRAALHGTPPADTDNEDSEADR